MIQKLIASLFQLSLKNQDYAKYVENTIAFRDLTAFVCEDVDDMTLLIKKLRNEQKLNINVVHQEPANSMMYQSRIPIDQLKYGLIV